MTSVTFKLIVFMGIVLALLAIGVIAIWTLIWNANPLQKQRAAAILEFSNGYFSRSLEVQKAQLEEYKTLLDGYKKSGASMRRIKHALSMVEMHLDPEHYRELCAITKNHYIALSLDEEAQTSKGRKHKVQ
jgi:hypothetical protein